MNVDVYNLKGEAMGKIELDDKIFRREWNPDLVHQVYLAQVANRRKNYAHVKERGEVRGGGKKPWRQKGTGRARHGSIRSPLWKGGGVTHGPRSDRQYGKKINKKMRKAAIMSLVSKKLADQELKIVDSLNIESRKTKELDFVLKQFLNHKKNSKKLSVLLIPSKENKGIFRVASNIPKVKSLNAGLLNIDDLLKYKNVLVDKRVVAAIGKNYE